METLSPRNKEKQPIIEEFEEWASQFKDKTKEDVLFATYASYVQFIKSSTVDKNELNILQFDQKVKDIEHNYSIQVLKAENKKKLEKVHTEAQKIREEYQAGAEIRIEQVEKAAELKLQQVEEELVTKDQQIQKQTQEISTRVSARALTLSYENKMKSMVQELGDKDKKILDLEQAFKHQTKMIDNYEAILQDAEKQAHEDQIRQQQMQAIWTSPIPDLPLAFTVPGASAEDMETFSAFRKSVQERGQKASANSRKRAAASPTMKKTPDRNQAEKPSSSIASTSGASVSYLELPRKLLFLGDQECDKTGPLPHDESDDSDPDDEEYHLAISAATNEVLKTKKEKKYFCKWPQCKSKGFSRFDNLQAHMKQHVQREEERKLKRSKAKK